MAVLDTIEVTNPTKEDFAVRFNGELYALQAGEKRAWPAFLANHIAKHLSDKMLCDEIAALKRVASDNPYRPQVAQLMVYDNPKRRMTLYQILKSEALVEECIKAFNFKSFVGNIRDYAEFVEKEDAKEERRKAAKEVYDRAIESKKGKVDVTEKTSDTEKDE